MTVGVGVRNAFDDYPLLASNIGSDSRRSRPIVGECIAALHEINQLRAWKAEAIVVLKRWDEVADRVDAEIGELRSTAVGREIDGLRYRLEHLEGYLQPSTKGE